MFNLKQNEGFTLAELLVVISIISLLASFVFSGIRNIKEEAINVTVRQQIGQIIRAAELVYNEYGYYPNDSHGSIICPKDIFVDSSNTKTFGNFIQACNDPLGHPYEWNNICENGDLRRSDGSTSCTPYSDENDGAVGILYRGLNNQPDACTGDDICFGIRGHTIYNWEEEATEPPPPIPESCVDLISSCGGLNDSLSCFTRDDCVWNPSNCSGTYSVSCDLLTSEASCLAKTPSCAWGGGGCSGTPNLCSIYIDSGSCGSVGCSWVSSVCSGTYGSSCDIFGDEPSCVNEATCIWEGGGCSGTPDSCPTYTDLGFCSSMGCSWTAPECSGTAVTCISIPDEATCGTQSGCSWNKPQSYCKGTHSNCSTYDSATCPSQLNCSWNPGGCSGTPNPCTNYVDSGLCSTASCTWTNSTCSGTYSAPCSIFIDENDCGTEITCSWGGESCAGTPNPCGAYADSPSCVNVNCSWTDPDCSGSYSMSCGPFGNESSCTGQAGCSWIGEVCSGSAIPCTTYIDEANCASQYGCSWQ